MLVFNAVVVIFLIFLNGFFAMSELAVVSARRGRLQQMAQEGSKGAARALKLVDDPTSFLSTVQVGITLVGIFACLLYTSPSPRDQRGSRMPSSA